MSDSGRQDQAGLSTPSLYGQQKLTSGNQDGLINFDEIKQELAKEIFRDQSDSRDLLGPRRGFPGNENWWHLDSPLARNVGVTEESARLTSDSMTIESAAGAQPVFALPDTIRFKVVVSGTYFPHKIGPEIVHISIIPKRRISEHFYDTVLVLWSPNQRGKADYEAQEVLLGTWSALWDHLTSPRKPATTSPSRIISDALFSTGPSKRDITDIRVDLRDHRLSSEGFGGYSWIRGWGWPKDQAQRGTIYCAAAVGIGLATLGNGRFVYAMDPSAIHLSSLDFEILRMWRLSEPRSLLEHLHERYKFDMLFQSEFSSDRTEVIISARSHPTKMRDQTSTTANVSQILRFLEHAVYRDVPSMRDVVAGLRDLNVTGFELSDTLKLDEFGLQPIWNRHRMRHAVRTSPRSSDPITPARVGVRVDLLWFLHQHVPLRCIRAGERVIGTYSSSSGRFIYFTDDYRVEVSIHLPDGTDIRDFGPLREGRTVDVFAAVPTSTERSMIGTWQRLPVFEICMHIRKLSWTELEIEPLGSSQNAALDPFKSVFKTEGLAEIPPIELSKDGCFARWSPRQQPGSSLEVFPWTKPPDVHAAYRWEWQTKFRRTRFLSKLCDYSLIAEILAQVNFRERIQQPAALLVFVPMEMGATGNIYVNAQAREDSLRQYCPQTLRRYVLVLGKARSLYTHDWVSFRVRFESERAQYLEFSSPSLSGTRRIRVSIAMVSGLCAIQVAPELWALATKDKLLRFLSIRLIDQGLQNRQSMDIKWLDVDYSVSTQGWATSLDFQHESFFDRLEKELNRAEMTSDATPSLLDLFERSIGACSLCLHIGNLTAHGCHPLESVVLGHRIQSYFRPPTAAFYHCLDCGHDCYNLMGAGDYSSHDTWLNDTWLKDPDAGCQLVCSSQSQLHSAEDLPGCYKHVLSPEHDSRGQKVMTEEERRQADQYQAKLNELAKAGKYSDINGPGYQMWPGKGVKSQSDGLKITEISEQVLENEFSSLGCRDQAALSQRRNLLSAFDQSMTDLEQFCQWIETPETPFGLDYSDLQLERFQELSNALVGELPANQALAKGWSTSEDSSTRIRVAQLCTMARYPAEVMIKRESLMQVLDIYRKSPLADTTRLAHEDVKLLQKQARFRMFEEMVEAQKEVQASGTDVMRHCALIYVHQWKHLGAERTLGELRLTFRRIAKTLKDGAAKNSKYIWIDQLINWLPLASFGVSWGGLEHDVFRERFADRKCRIYVESFAADVTRHAKHSFWASWEMQADPRGGIQPMQWILPRYAMDHLELNFDFRHMTRDDIALLGMLASDFESIQASFLDLGHEGILSSSQGGATEENAIFCAIARAGFVRATPVRAAIFQRDLLLAKQEDMEAEGRVARLSQRQAQRPGWLVETMRHWMSRGRTVTEPILTELSCRDLNGNELGRAILPEGVPNMLHYLPGNLGDPAFPLRTDVRWHEGL